MRADPAIRDLEAERLAGEVSHRSVGPDERAVDERIRPVGVPHERQRDVRAVVEVDREPVPPTAPDADEVAPLVVEPP